MTGFLLKGEWYDLRDIGNAVGELSDQLKDWGAPDWTPYVVSTLIGCVGILLWTVLSVLAFIWIERRVVALMQNRIGPNRVGPAGLLQPVADALKLLLKEAITPKGADRILFWAGPIIVFIPTLAVFAVMPFSPRMILADLNVGVLFLIAIAGINTPAVFLAGWSSNNKYAMLGAMRTIAMLISYEIIQVLALLGPVLFVSSMRLADIVQWQDHYNTWIFFIQPIGLLAYIIAGAVETNRSPMDIAEAESEIVAGYHTEYGGIKFGFFYQAEYLAGFAVAAAIVALYMGGWTAWGLEDYVPGWLIYLTKLYTVFFIYIWTRGTLPRLRIDQLMSFAWKFLLPIMLVNTLVVGAEVLIWRENELSGGEALPVIGFVNFFFGVAMVYAWARFLGHGDEPRSERTAVLTRDVGSIHYVPGEAFLMDGTGVVIAFWVLAALTVGSASAVVVVRNLIHAVVALIGVFAGLSGLYITLSADFIAITQILIYIGAISILFLFAIVLTPQRERNNAEGFLRLPALLVSGLVGAVLVYAAVDTQWNVTESEGFAETAADIGELLLDKYVLPFEIASVLLIVAVIGSIVLVRPEPMEED